MTGAEPRESEILPRSDAASNDERLRTVAGEQEKEYGSIRPKQRVNPTVTVGNQSTVKLVGRAD